MNFSDPDFDIQSMTREQLKNEIVKLRQGIRQHRDSSGHDLCWYHPELWQLLPDKIEPKPDVPSFCEFIQNCATYRQSLETQNMKFNDTDAQKIAAEVQSAMAEARAESAKDIEHLNQISLKATLSKETPPDKVIWWVVGENNPVLDCGTSDSFEEGIQDLLKALPSLWLLGIKRGIVNCKSPDGETLNVFSVNVSQTRLTANKAPDWKRLLPWNW